MILSQPQTEATFWLPQFQEHASFTAEGLVDPTLQAQAQQLVEQARQITSGNIRDVAGLAMALNDFHQPLLARLQSGEWLGWLYPSLIAHMMREQNWYLGVIQGLYTPRDLLCFGNLDAGEAADVLSKSIDPNPKFSSLSNAAHDRSGAILSVASACDGAPVSWLASNSTRLIGALDTLVHSTAMVAALKNVPWALVEHDAREAAHFLAILRNLKATGQLT